MWRNRALASGRANLRLFSRPWYVRRPAGPLPCVNRRSVSTRQPRGRSCCTPSQLPPKSAVTRSISALRARRCNPGYAPVNSPIHAPQGLQSRLSPCHHLGRHALPTGSYRYLRPRARPASTVPSLCVDPSPSDPDPSRAGSAKRRPGPPCQAHSRAQCPVSAVCHHHGGPPPPGMASTLCGSSCPWLRSALRGPAAP